MPVCNDGAGVRPQKGRYRVQRHRKTLLSAAIILLWAALLAPFFLGAGAAHPATDDFTFAAYTHATWLKTGSLLHVVKDALSYALRTWRDWQGTVTGVILMALNPAVFGLEHYGAHAVVLLALILASALVFLRHFLGKRLGLPRRAWLPLALALSAMQLVFLPDMVEGIYWFNGAWFYMGAQSAALLTLVLCDHLAVSCAGRGRQAFMALCACVLLFALGMDNYITAMMTCAALLMMALQRAWAARSLPEEQAQEKKTLARAAIRTALLLLPIGAGLLLSVIAPGNAVRMETDGAHQSGMGWLLSSILWTMRDAAGYLLRFSLKTPLLMLLCLALPALCCLLPQEEDVRRRCPPVWATLTGAYLILCAMIIPHMYSSGYAGSGRVVNMYHSYVLLALPIALCMAILRLSGRTRAFLAGRRAQGVCAAAALCALAVWAAGGQLGNYVKLVRDQLDGTQAAYIAQFEHEYALCEAGGPEDDVALPAWTVQTVTGKPTAYEDAAMWTNESMARYFGVRSVFVQDGAQ